MSPFLSDCPSLMLGIAIHCIQHSQAMLERGVCELAHSFFFIGAVNRIKGKRGEGGQLRLVRFCLVQHDRGIHDQVQRHVRSVGNLLKVVTYYKCTASTY